MKANGQLHAPAALFPEKEHMNPLIRRLGGPHSRSGRSSEGKNSPVVQPIVQSLPEFMTQLSFICHTLDQMFAEQLL